MQVEMLRAMSRCRYVCSLSASVLVRVLQSKFRVLFLSRSILLFSSTLSSCTHPLTIDDCVLCKDGSSKTYRTINVCNAQPGLVPIKVTDVVVLSTPQLAKVSSTREYLHCLTLSLCEKIHDLTDKLISAACPRSFSAATNWSASSPTNKPTTQPTRIFRPSAKVRHRFSVQ